MHLESLKGFRLDGQQDASQAGWETRPAVHLEESQVILAEQCILIPQLSWEAVPPLIALLGGVFSSNNKAQ